MNLEIFEMSDVGVAVPGLDTVGSASISDTARKIPEESLNPVEACPLSSFAEIS
jgi:hypothetical protein